MDFCFETLTLAPITKSLINLDIMTKKEIDRKLDEIIDFSGVEKFIDTVVKKYSSVNKIIEKSVKNYCKDVKRRRFPSLKNVYTS